MDGIDVALTEVAEAEGGRLRCSLAAFTTVPYRRQVEHALAALLDPSAQQVTARDTLRELCALNFTLGEEFASAANGLIGESGSHPSLIASHGQTVYHLAQSDGRPGFVPSTLQLGEPAVIAERTGLTTIADFRVADIAAGGQGAPLASYADLALLASAAEDRAALNIGGIANVTVLPATGAAGVFAFDTGPGNMLIDRAVRSLFGPELRYDAGGAIAAKGAVRPELLRWLLGHPYFSRPAPKTTGHEDFGAHFYALAWQQAQALRCGSEDFVATLTELTAQSIAEALPPARRLIVSGGGAHNASLLAALGRQLERRFGPMQPACVRSDAFGLPVDAKEAMAFALLGFQALRGRNNNVPACTGARHPAVLGKIVPGANHSELKHVIG